MKMPVRLKWTGLRPTPLPAAAAGAVAGERVLGWESAASGEVIVATPTQLIEIDAGRPRWRRAWHLVDSGRWDQESATLRVTWVDGSPPQAWRLPLDTSFPEVFRARVQASVVLSEQVAVPGGQVRVVVRKDLADQRLLTQWLPGRGVDPTSPEVRAAAAAALARLGEQVGLT